MNTTTILQRRYRWSLDGAGAARGRRERESIVIELADGRRGECAPLPGWSRETLDECAAALVAGAALPPAARFAVESAQLEDAALPAVPIAHVVDTVEEARAAIAAGAAALKVKIAPDRLDHVAAIAALGVAVRLDANRSFTREQARALRFAHDVEFVEEPCPEAWRLPDLPWRLALDESVLEVGAHPRADVLVLKPSLLGLAETLALARGRDVVITHALEGPIGRRAVARVARMIGGARAHGIAEPPRPRVYLHEKLTDAERLRQSRIVEELPVSPDTVYVLFTSGSTGDPVPVPITRAVIDRQVAATWALLGRRDDDRWWLGLSLAHAGGLAIVERCAAAGIPTTAVLEEATLASLVPAQLARLLEDPAWRPAPRLRAVLLGGAAAPRALLERAAARGVPFLTTYGMTETFGQVATAPLAFAGRVDQPLMPLPGFAIVAGTAEAPSVIRIRPDRGDEVVTRDLGYLAADGALVVIGRADDMIITGGENVAPATVEAAVARTPGVREVVAFGVPDETWGQIIGVAIVGTYDPGAWRALPSHLRPRRVATVDALPLLPSGKIDRRAAARIPTTSA